MAHILILQENGKYSIWSTIVDYIILSDLTKEGVYKIKEDMAVEQAKLDTKSNVDYLFNRIGKYKDLPNNIEEANLIMKNVHGTKL